AEFMEIPRWLGALIVLSLFISAGNLAATLSGRVEERIYPSIWYLIGAAVWAPLGLAAGVLPAFTGTAGSIATLFSLNAYLTLFLSMSGIGAIYYVIPRATGNPLYSYRLALIGFWSLALAGPLAGQARGVFGPGQDWLESIGITSSIALLVPALATLVNVVGTLHGAWGKTVDHPSIRYAVGGTIVWAVAIAQGAGQGMRSIAEIIGLSEAIPGQIWLLLIASALWSASAIIYAFPRLMGRMWAGRIQLTASFWASVAAAALVAAGTWGAAIASGVAYRTGVLLQNPASFGGGFDLVSAVVSRFRLAYVAGFVVFAVAQWIFAMTVFRTTASGELHAIEVVAVGETV
ncbi:MAG: cbb3-type cytochrome c oxidase subunit I, partial [Acidimicrobiia bacterium]